MCNIRQICTRLHGLLGQASDEFEVNFYLIKLKKWERVFKVDFLKPALLFERVRAVTSSEKKVTHEDLISHHYLAVERVRDSTVEFEPEFHRYLNAPRT